MAMSEAMSRRIRAVFNAFNFWAIILYNVLALNSLDFARLVARRLLIRGKTAMVPKIFYLSQTVLILSVKQKQSINIV